MTNAVIGALRATLGLDSAAFEKGVKKAEATSKGFGASLKKTLGSALTAATVAAAGIATALGGAALAIRSTIDTADEFSKLAQKIGIPIDELSQLAYAADLSGVSMEGLTTSVRKVTTLMDQAADGSKTAQLAFSKLGIDIRNSNGGLKSASEIIAEVSDRFAGMRNGTEKTAAAVALFGRAGADMIPLLNGGSEAIRQAMAEADALGLTLDQVTGTAAENFNDNLSRVSYAATGLARQLTAAVAPALAVASNGFVAAARGTVSLIRDLPTIAEYAAAGATALALVFSPALVVAAGELTAAIVAGLVPALASIGAVIAANPLTAFAVAVAGAGIAIYAFRDDIKQALGIDVVGIVKSAANLVINSFRAAFVDVKLVFSELPNVIGGAMTGAVNLVIRALNSMVNAAKSAINQVIAAANYIPGVDIKAFDTGSSAIAQLPNAYADALGSAVDKRNADIAAIMASDPIGDIGAKISEAFTSAKPATASLSGSVGDLADQLDRAGSAAGGAAKKASDPWDGLRKATGKAKSSVDDLQRSMEGVGQNIGGALSGLISQTTTWQEALQSVLRSIAQALIAQSDFGGGSGGGSFIKGLFGGLIGFASGGSIMPGGASSLSGVDSQLVAFRKKPSEQVDIYTPGTRSAGGGVSVPIVINAPGSDAAALSRLEANMKQLGDSIGKRAVAAMHQMNKRGYVS